MVPVTPHRHLNAAEFYLPQSIIINQNSTNSACVCVCVRSQGATNTHAPELRWIWIGLVHRQSSLSSGTGGHDERIVCAQNNFVQRTFKILGSRSLRNHPRPSSDNVKPGSWFARYPAPSLWQRANAHGAGSESPGQFGRLKVQGPGPRHGECLHRKWVVCGGGCFRVWCQKNISKLKPPQSCSVACAWSARRVGKDDCNQPNAHSLAHLAQGRTSHKPEVARFE